MRRANLTLEDLTDDDSEVDLGSIRTASAFDTGRSRSSLSLSFDLPPSSPAISLKSAFGSPSSPDLIRVLRPSALSRSQTLPRVPQTEIKPRRGSSGIEGLDVDDDVLAKIRRWILGVAIVDFDIDSGPVVNGIFPPLFLLPEESENIAFLSFPDSLQFDQGSQNHSFRIREHQLSISSEKRPAPIDGYIYGFSHFSQRRDPTSKRGYEQRSLVFLTHHPYPALFSSLSSIFGPLFSAHGLPMLETACYNIATWSDPTPGATVELGFLGSVLQVELPHCTDEQQLTECDPKSHILASSSPFFPPPVLLFEASLSHLWSIWECVVLCEPILIFGASPSQTSQAIWWLRDLLRPIPTAGDIRPYFTIHDRDHSALVNKLPPKSGLLLGVTNPFFERSCLHWPHILSLGRRIPPNTATKNTSTVAPGPSPGWKTKVHKRYISKDHALLKQLESACRGTEQERMSASWTLRRHFYSRSNELLIPLTRYLNTLIPTPSEVAGHQRNSHSGPLRLKPFNTSAFFASLKVHGSTLPFRSTSKRKNFYERWLKTPSFGLWLAQQEQIVQGVLKQSLDTTS
ncbi:hypothetical protein EV421DRAFT_1840584 [Armillaria borealis]|uniref:UDENN domain-containing protein n=1 Tax=Armillaria borealis TaxID=47425 RepID=A0AA39MHS4_9AGAR|nr:hypothetical protein EV421DRAFT_1840584 [Armillaria borealis]